MKSLHVSLALLLVAGLAVPAYAQTVVINEVEINPPGNDAASASEWVELYNPTDSPVDLTGWEIASTTVLKKTITIPPGTVINPDQFWTFLHERAWFTDANETVELRNSTGAVIDQTPLISDTRNDFTSWQRIYDGYDNDEDEDWKFAKSTARSSNGKLVNEQASQDVSITLSTDNPAYIFGDTAIFSGSVSERVFVEKPHFAHELITLTITGPSYNNEITLYPDSNLDYESSMDLRQVLGVGMGEFTVSASYAGATAEALFTVGFELPELSTRDIEDLAIQTDKLEYIPGDSVVITGSTTSTILYEGIQLTVSDPNGDPVYQGTVFPTDGQFQTDFFVTTVNPSFGTYTLDATYSDLSASHTFDIVTDEKEDVQISLSTDKPAYAIGDTVEINGRLNDRWVRTLDLEIVQTRQTSISAGGSGFKILDSLQVKGDGTFDYSFVIPDNQIRYGDYKITVSKEIGSATTIVSAVEDPSNFVVSDDPITIQTDEQTYDFGDTVMVTGFVKDPFANSSYVAGTPVLVTIHHADGTPLMVSGIYDGPRGVDSETVSVRYDFTAIPETSGSYAVSIDILQNIFSEGDYIVKSVYHGNSASATFSIVNSLHLADGAAISTDKEVYGLGETVTLSGILPPSGATAVSISLVRPDGTQTGYGATLDNQQFTWTWTTPVSERQQSGSADQRSITKSNFGVYKINISTDSYNENVFFKVSEDPENDSLSIIPIFVSPEKSLYKPGERLHVIGTVLLDEQDSGVLRIPPQVHIRIVDGSFPYKMIHESRVYPDQGGEFSSMFELPATVFADGPYTIKADYKTLSAKSEFSVANDFTFRSDDPLELLLYVDKTEYHPGDIVTVSGKPSKLVYLDQFDVSFIQQSESEITCGSFYCGEHVGPVTIVHPSSSGSFVHELQIPDSPSSIGSYEVTVDADFDTKSIQFDVVERPEIIIPEVYIEKQSRIPDSTITILTETKTVDSATFAPRVLSGSLITPDLDSIANVNLRVLTEAGTCIIGPDCLVSNSTRLPGQIYQAVEADGLNLNVRYSGPDVRLEKFNILPESSDEFLPDANWTVEVIKDDQISRFYYKITYKHQE